MGGSRKVTLALWEASQVKAQNVKSKKGNELGIFNAGIKNIPTLKVI